MQESQQILRRSQITIAEEQLQRQNMKDGAIAGVPPMATTRWVRAFSSSSIEKNCDSDAKKRPPPLLTCGRDNCATRNDRRLGMHEIGAGGGLGNNGDNELQSTNDCDVVQSDMVISGGAGEIGTLSSTNEIRRDNNKKCARDTLRRFVLNRSKSLTAMEQNFLQNLAKHGDEKDVETASSVLQNDKIFFDIPTPVPGTERSQSDHSHRSAPELPHSYKGSMESNKGTGGMSRRLSCLNSRREVGHHNGIWKAHHRGVSTNGTIGKSFLKRHSSAGRLQLLLPSSDPSTGEKSASPSPGLLIQGRRLSRRNRAASISSFPAMRQQHHIPPTDVGSRVTSTKGMPPTMVLPRLDRALQREVSISSLASQQGAERVIAPLRRPEKIGERLRASSFTVASAETNSGLTLPHPMGIIRPEGLRFRSTSCSSVTSAVMADNDHEPSSISTKMQHPLPLHPRSYSLTRTLGIPRPHSLKDMMRLPSIEAKSIGSTGAETGAMTIGLLAKQINEGMEGKLQTDDLDDDYGVNIEYAEGSTALPPNMFDGNAKPQASVKYTEGSKALPPATDILLSCSSDTEVASNMTELVNCQEQRKSTQRSSEPLVQTTPRMSNLSVPEDARMVKAATNQMEELSPLEAWMKKRQLTQSCSTQSFGAIIEPGSPDRGSQRGSRRSRGHPPLPPRRDDSESSLGGSYPRREGYESSGSASSEILSRARPGASTMETATSSAPDGMSVEESLQTFDSVGTRSCGSDTDANDQVKDIFAKGEPIYKLPSRGVLIPGEGSDALKLLQQQWHEPIRTRMRSTGYEIVGGDNRTHHIEETIGREGNLADENNDDLGAVDHIWAHDAESSTEAIEVQCEDKHSGKLCQHRGWNFSTGSFGSAFYAAGGVIMRSLSSEDLRSQKSMMQRSSRRLGSDIDDLSQNGMAVCVSFDDFDDDWDLHTESVCVEDADEVEPHPYCDPWQVLRDEYAEDYYGEDALPFHILGTSADDTTAHPHVLSPPLMESLQSFLPNSVAEGNFWLKFSLVRDGSSLLTLLQKVRGSTHTIVALETVDGEVFGSFTSIPWRISQGYFGTGESFLWRMRERRTTLCHSIIDQAQLESEIDVFPWMGENNCVQICQQDKIALGGGSLKNLPSDKRLRNLDEESGFGLVIASDLLHGSSSPCATFANPGLSNVVKSGRPFEVANLEVWALTPCISVEEAQNLELMKLFLESNRNNEV